MRPTDAESGALGGQFDDLRKIAGIGPTLAARLTGAGITRYRDLAALTAGKLAELAGVAEGRVTSQDWIGQAQRLDDAASHQEYATFHVELLLDEGTVRRTKTRHYQTDTEESWSGWDAGRLIAVITRKAALDTTASRPAALSVDGPHLAANGAVAPATAPTVVRATVGIAAGGAGFTIEVTAVSVRDGERHPIARATGTVAAEQPASLELTGPPLPSGMYRLEAAATVSGTGEPASRQRALGDIVLVR